LLHPAQAHEGHADRGSYEVGPKAAAQLDKACSATQQYRTFEAAKADGYVLDSECAADPPPALAPQGELGGDGLA
jgi:hypothetical protein